MLQRNILFQPDTRRPDPVRSRAADMIRVTAATADGLELEGWWSPPTGGRRTILYFHGNGGDIGDRDGKARRTIDLGYGPLMGGDRGYGGNPGKPGEHWQSTRRDYSQE